MERQIHFAPESGAKWAIWIIGKSDTHYREIR